MSLSSRLTLPTDYAVYARWSKEWGYSSMAWIDWIMSKLKSGKINLIRWFVLPIQNHRRNE